MKFLIFLPRLCFPDKNVSIISRITSIEDVFNRSLSISCERGDATGAPLCLTLWYFTGCSAIWRVIPVQHRHGRMAGRVAPCQSPFESPLLGKDLHHLCVGVLSLLLITSLPPFAPPAAATDHRCYNKI